jgi:hypothetical protein
MDKQTIINTIFSLSSIIDALNRAGKKKDEIDKVMPNE